VGTVPSLVIPFMVNRIQ